MFCLTESHASCSDGVHSPAMLSDVAGRSYGVDRSNSRVQIFDREGSFISDWTCNEVGRPYGIAVGTAGRVYVVDIIGNRVQKFLAD